MVKRVTVSLSLEAAHLGAVLDVACCPQGTYLASASVDHSVSVWRLRGFYEGDTRVSGRLPRRGDQAHQAVLQGDRVRAWAGQHGSYVQAVAFSTASVLASVGGDRICRLWDVETGTMLHLLKCSGALSCVNFSPSGHLVAAGGWLGALGVWDVGSGRELAGKPHPVLLHHHDSVSSVSWTPDSRALVVCSSDGIVWAWDVVKGRFLGGRACAAGNYMLDDSHEAVQEAQHLKLHRFEDHGMASSAVFFSQSFLGAGLHSQSSRSLTLFPVRRPFLAIPPPPPPPALPPSLSLSLPLSHITHTNKHTHSLTHSHSLSLTLTHSGRSVRTMRSSRRAQSAGPLRRASTAAITAPPPQQVAATQLPPNRGRRR